MQVLCCTSAVRRLSTVPHLAAPLRNPASNAALTVRLARRADIPSIKAVNLQTLPENYAWQFYVYHLEQWPHLALVAEAPVAPADRERDLEPAAHRDRMEKLGFLRGAPPEQASPRSEVVGYVLGRVGPLSAAGPQEEGLLPTHTQGQITSLAVLPRWRRRGLAQGLMRAVHGQFAGAHGAAHVHLHVRRSNGAALHLYGRPAAEGGLGYRPLRNLPSYYPDGEEALLMQACLLESEGHDEALAALQPGFLEAAEVVGNAGVGAPSARALGAAAVVATTPPVGAQALVVRAVPSTMQRTEQASSLASEPLQAR